MASALSFRPALADEATQIATLINESYRGETSRLGWTTEADLLDGLRTDEAEVRQLIESDHSMIMLCLHGNELMGSVHLEKMDEGVHIGMFVVKPTLQKQGIGKQLLAEAEWAATERWRTSRFSMMVITLRHELIAFYERRGYRRTGVLKEFPVNPDVWKPKVTGLQLEKLEKLLSL
ncbi:MAG TPA: GNAT family N-acetyltransferase [Methylophilaceae bacterium]|nr:GNAT family N-acetyltransferase [Methylophilaceae bacterium]